MSILIMIVGVVFAFGLVIFVHEFGHFIVAKKSGVKVDQFSFGFGREIVGFQWGETRYTVNWIPLGGYVKMAGEIPEDYEGPLLEGGEKDADDRDKSRDFMQKSWKVRTLIALAGPAMNYVLAALIFFLVLMIWGNPVQTNKTDIGEIFVGMPAESAGFQSGDTILSVEREPVEDFLAIAEKIQARPGLETEIEVERKGETFLLSVTPQEDNESGKGVIGITPAYPEVDYEDIGIPMAAKTAVLRCWQLSALTLGHLTEKIISREKPDLAGPIGISQAIVKAIKSGAQDFFQLVAYLSVAIGLFNLFPVPMLDGGHVVYYLIEGIRRKPLSMAVMNRANYVGFAMLIALFLFATMNDLTRGRSASQQDEPAPATSAAE